MKAPTLDELVLLPEPLALQRHFDAKSYRVFRWLLLLVLMLSLVGFGTAIERHNGFGIAVFLLNTLVSVVLFALRRREVFTRNFRQILLAYLFIQILALKVASAQDPGELGPFIPVAFVLLLFRMRFYEHLSLYAWFWMAAIFPLAWVGVRQPAAPEQGMIIGVSVNTLTCLALAVGLSQLERKRFLAIWRKEHARNRERLRMREEIEYARKIQLSMLPQGAPDVDWLDLAAVSLPATEVGGDYYEYFPLGDSRLAVVIGDVAGHGLASGLLLSGVRSCLYLLEEDLASPIQVLERLNHMVRRTTDKRTYVTLLCAVLDRGEDVLTVASAGHPPVLHFDPRSSRFDEVGDGAPPLGTSLDARYLIAKRSLAAGDLLVFYTDGLLEARNVHGQEYGEARLQRAVTRAAGSRSAREVRDAILGDLSNFKGDQEQTDDLTLVVARLR